MHRIPKSPIGLLIRKNRFRLIGEELTEVVAALGALRTDYEALARGGQVDVVGVVADLDRHIDTLTERAAVMRGVAVEAVSADASSQSDRTKTKKHGPAKRPTDEAGAIERRLATLERRLRWLIAHTPSDPPTQTLYVGTLLIVEREQWRLEQQAKDSGQKS